MCCVHLRVCRPLFRLPHALHQCAPPPQPLCRLTWSNYLNFHVIVLFMSLFSPMFKSGSISAFFTFLCTALSEPPYNISVQKPQFSSIATVKPHFWRAPITNPFLCCGWFSFSSCIDLVWWLLIISSKLIDVSASVAERIINARSTIAAYQGSKSNAGCVNK